MTDQPTKPPERFTPAEGLREMVSVEAHNATTEGGEHESWSLLLPDYPRIGEYVEIAGILRTVKMVTWSTKGVTLRVE